VATKDGLDMNVRNTQTGKSQSAHRLRARLPVHARQIFSEIPLKKKHKDRLDPQDIHARLILMIGGTLALTFFIVSVGVVYALIFVTQPIGAQAPNDAAFIDLLKTLAIFLTGSLGGVLAGNGLKPKEKSKLPL
jgi:hypothetical protein